MTEALTALQLALLARRAEAERRLLGAEPIAVVGMGLRFPSGSGHANLESPEDFWEFLLAGREAMGEVPPSRWNLEHYYDSHPGTPGKMHCRHGAFLAGVDQFDAAGFGISPKEAQAMDPQHRLVLEVAQEALERAGLQASQLKGMAAGVYMGLCSTDYAWRQLRQGAPDSSFDVYFATGSSFSMIAGRLAYILGLHGPALAIDTACSSSLVAVDLACRSLRDRSTDLALAGGVNLMLSPVSTLCFARSGMLASDGHCRSFDAAADGFVRGEGCGVVVLKRLADAIGAGDAVLAVIRASAVNQNGASAGFAVPNGEAQTALLEHALKQAQLPGDAIDVIEAHGTASPLGDPIELKALAPVYARPERSTALRLGSVKTNLGSLEGAGGIASLIKAVLMVQHGQIPPHLHLRQPTPHFNWHDWALHVPTRVEPWPERSAPRRAAVSSFGLSGTNAHVLLEQAPPEVAHGASPSPAAGAWSASGDWFLISARTQQALQQFAQRVVSWLPEQPSALWCSICATSRLARTTRRWRLALQASSAEQALLKLRHWLESDASVSPGSDRTRETIQVTEVQSPSTRLAFRLTSTSQARHWQAWLEHGVQASALVFEPAQATLASELAGQPPQLRLISAGSDATELLAHHGYGLVLPLEQPSPAALVDLWLAGLTIDWSPLAPGSPWQKVVLPTTPFDRQHCWIKESGPSEPSPRDETSQEPAPPPAAADGGPLVSRLRQLADELNRRPTTAEALPAVERCLSELLTELGGFSAGALTSTTRLDELGLDSLMAVELASAVQTGLNVNLSLGALVGEPTLGGLANHLLALLHNPDAVVEPALDLGKEAQLPADLLSTLAGSTAQTQDAAMATDTSHTRPESPQAILLTGATGFLGAFLLADQLERHPSLTVYCLVRADGVRAARTRVRANLERYGLWNEAWEGRIVGLPGDLALPRLGLDATTWASLAQRLDGILHNGAQLSYVAPYGQLRTANVGGTLEVLRLATDPLRSGRSPLPLEHISSVAVFEAAAYRGQPIDETLDLSAWEGIHLGYSQTKWVSERLVVAAAKAGLPVRIYRPPLIAGHSHTGAWHEQDFLHRLVRGCLALGQAPEIPMELDLVPVDYVVNAIGALAWQPVAAAPDVLHLHHPQPVLWSDMLDSLIALGAPLQRVDLQHWMRAVAAEPTNPLYPLQPFFTHRWGPEQLTYPELNQASRRARPQGQRTRAILEPLGVTCPGFDALLEPYSRTFLADLLAHG